MDTDIFKSPKRKRDDDLRLTTLQTSGLSRNFSPRRSSNASESETGSPRMMVAKKFQRLELRGSVDSTGSHLREHNEIDFEPLDQADQMNVEIHENPKDDSKDKEMFHFTAGSVSPTTRDESPSSQLQNAASDLASASIAMRLATNSGIKNSTESGNSKSSDESNTSNERNNSPGPQSNSKRQSSSTGKNSKNSSAKSLKTSSPTDSTLWWADSEISGYSPQDPDEDDYGINGVGYQKTASVAEALRQKRRKQIEEYRRREAGEARAARRNWREKSEGIFSARGRAGRIGKGGCRSTMSGGTWRGRSGEGNTRNDPTLEAHFVNDEGDRMNEGRSVRFEVG